MLRDPILLALTACAVIPAAATVVLPRQLTFEEIVCSAERVFVGKSQNFRIVPAPDGINCASAKRDRGVAVCTATVMALDILVEQPLAPAEWANPGMVVLLIGSGYSIEGTRTRFEGQRHIFMTESKADGPSGVHVPALEAWDPALPPEAEERVRRALENCRPKR